MFGKALRRWLVPNKGESGTYERKVCSEYSIKVKRVRSGGRCDDKFQVVLLPTAVSHHLTQSGQPSPNLSQVSVNTTAVPAVGTPMNPKDLISRASDEIKNLRAENDLLLAKIDNLEIANSTLKATAKQLEQQQPDFSELESLMSQSTFRVRL